MQKFIIKIGVVFAFLVCINILYMNTNYWKTENHVYKFKSIPSKIDIGIIGSSHAQVGGNFALYPNIRAFNFALSQQSFSYDYHILLHYVHHFNKHSVLFIPVSYFSFKQSQKSIDEIKNRYYRILPVKLIYNANYIEKFKYGMFPIFSAGTKLKHIIFDSPKDEIDIFNTPNMKKDVDGFLLPSRAQWKIDTWKNDVMTIDTAQIDQNTAYLKNIITLCKRHDITPILITFPVTTALYNLYPQNEIKEFYDTIHTISENTGVPYIDFSNDERFRSSVLFFDSDHLNYAGSEIITKILLQLADSYLAH